jgi:rubrerythrin
LLRGVKEATGLGPKKKVYRLTKDGRNLIDKIVKENFESDEFFIQKYLELLDTFKEEFEKAREEEEEEELTLCCSSCGYNLSGAEKFCPQCGYSISYEGDVVSN